MGSAGGMLPCSGTSRLTALRGGGEEAALAVGTWGGEMKSVLQHWLKSPWDPGRFCLGQWIIFN